MARRIGSHNREAERRIMEALQVRISARFERALSKSLVKDYRAAADAIERQEPIPEVGKDIGRIILAGWETSASTFGSRLIDQIGKRHGVQERKALLGDAFRLAFLEFSRRWIASKITQINQTTEGQIREIVDMGLQEGWGVDKLGREIRKRALPMSTLRAHVIARTETHFASGWANQTAAAESGLELVKEWCSTHDDRARESHMEADGQRQTLVTSFDVGGYKLDFPGDASGPAEEVIMCRCQAIYLEE